MHSAAHSTVLGTQMHSILVLVFDQTMLMDLTMAKQPIEASSRANSLGLPEGNRMTQFSSQYLHDMKM